jgi:hypothetical protein
MQPFQFNKSRIILFDLQIVQRLASNNVHLYISHVETIHLSKVHVLRMSNGVEANQKLLCPPRPQQ